MDGLTLYTCPHPKRRFGRPFDGGYVVAKLPGTYDLFLSGGVADDVSFELDVLEAYPGLETHAFDGSVDALPPDAEDSPIQFHKEFLTAGSLAPYMRGKQDVFLKMDIEGHEFRVMPSLFPDDIQRVKQLVLEVHTPGDIKLFPDYFKGLHDIEYEHLFDLFGNLKKTHTLVHVHANNGCQMHMVNDVVMPNVFECTFIRNEFVPLRVANTEPLPTPLDYPNIQGRPEYRIDWPPFVSRGAAGLNDADTKN